MKRLFLLLVALFVVATLQAQVMCYEFQFVGAELTYPDSRHRDGTTAPPQGGEKVYWVVNKSQMAAYMANFKGEYNEAVGARKMTIIYRSNSANRTAGSLNRKPEYNWVAGNLRYKAPDDFSKLTVEMKTNDGGRYVRSYKRINTLQAREKGTSSSRLAQTTPPGEKIHINATSAPRFLGDTSENSFREWFKREMPAQDSFDRVRRITFVIETDGSVTVEDIDTGIPRNEQLVQQVTEVLARSPKWTPAYDKDGKTPIRYRMNMYELFLRKTEAWLAREAQKAKEQAEQKAKEEAEREAYLRTPEGKARERQKIEDWCAQWGVGAFDRVICQSRGGAKLGGITVEELNERIRSASRPLVVITEYPACPPSRYLMQDLKTLLEAYEDQYDLYIVHLIPAVEAYQKALGLGTETPSVLFVYNGYGAYEVWVGYDRSEQQKFIAWFDRMMKKAVF